MISADSIPAPQLATPLGGLVVNILWPPVSREPLVRRDKTEGSRAGARLASNTRQDTRPAAMQFLVSWSVSLYCRSEARVENLPI